MGSGGRGGQSNQRLDVKIINHEGMAWTLCSTVLVVAIFVRWSWFAPLCRV